MDSSKVMFSPGIMPLNVNLPAVRESVYFLLVTVCAL